MKSAMNTEDDGASFNLQYVTQVFVMKIFNEYEHVMLMTGPITVPER